MPGKHIQSLPEETSVTNGPSMNDQRKQGIAGMFGRAAATYDQVGPHFFAYFGRRLVELARLSAGAHVLNGD
jgi:hypothetical protein